MTDSKARKAIIRARTQLVVREPFFGTLAIHLLLVERPGLGTMAVDGVHIYYDPEFVLKLNEEELVGVVAHEVHHCVYGHFSRRGHRDPKKWNIAGDFRINDDLKKVPFTLPYKPIGLKELMAGQIGHLYDPQFANMSTEEIYEKIPDPPQQPSGGAGTIIIDVGGCGSVMDAGSGPGDPDNDEGSQGKLSPAQVAHEWQANVRMAVSVARANNAGQTPGYLERIVTQLKRPKVSWRDLLHQFIDHSMTIDYSYRRPNRRGLSSGLIMPGTVPDALHELVMFADISGSISDEMMRAMVSECAGALEQGTCDKLWIVYADDGVRQVDQFERGDIVSAKSLGGGGTDFDDSFKWLAENAPEAACVIYLTDMETCSFGEDPGMPVFWGCYSTEDRLASIEPPFGTKVWIESAN